MGNAPQDPPHSVNRSMSVAMTNGLEKLEKLLSRRKRGPSCRASGLSISTSSCANIPQFPQTPYIRPTSNRMYARDEPSALERFSYRSNSLSEPSPDSPTKRFPVSRHSAASAHNHSSDPFSSRIPKRSSSLLSSRDFSLTSLDGYSFADAMTCDSSLGSSEVDKAFPSPKEVVPQIELRIEEDGVPKLGSIFCQRRVDTPPPSDNDDTPIPTTPVGGQIGGDKSRIPVVAHPSEPTPGPSPEVVPTPNELPVESAPLSAYGSIPLLKQESVKLKERPRREASAKDATTQEANGRLAVDDVRSQMIRDSVTRSARGSSRARSASSTTTQQRRSVLTSGICNEPTLREPNFGDFLCLRDEDIAEERPSTPPPPATFDVSSPSTVASSPSFVSSTSSRLRLFAPPSRPPVGRAPAPPPLSFPASMRNVASTSQTTSRTTSISISPRSLAPPLSPVSANQRAATAAAFEATRIAAKHHLDLVYVVQLWPERMAAGSSTVTARSLVSTSAPASPTRRAREGPKPRSGSSSSTRSHTITVGHPDSNGKRGRAAAATRRSPPLSSRVLAGHGLAVAKPPMFLSGTLHADILNHRSGTNYQRRWYEFRNADASAPDDYASGLGTAFFAKSVPTAAQRRRQSAAGAVDDANDAGAEGDDESGAALPIWSRSRPPNSTRNGVAATSCMNKGVLFVAYRKKGAVGQEAATTDLGELYRDAEVLVGLSLRAQDRSTQAQDGKEDADSPPSTGVSAAASMAATKRLADLFKPLPSAPLS